MDMSYHCHYGDNTSLSLWRCHIIVTMERSHHYHHGVYTTLPFLCANTSLFYTTLLFLCANTTTFLDKMMSYISQVLQWVISHNILITSIKTWHVCKQSFIPVKLLRSTKTAHVHCIAYGQVEHIPLIITYFTSCQSASTHHSSVTKYSFHAYVSGIGLIHVFPYHRFCEDHDCT